MATTSSPICNSSESPNVAAGRFGNKSQISPVVAIAQKVMPSVVGVKTYGTYNYWGRQIDNQELGSGSGIIYSEDGYVITNYHVIENATSVTVTLSDGAEYDARIVGADSSSDSDTGC